ncbi:MAG: PrsW family intramembrane metalloprotease [Marmoricola sp.]
MTRRRHSARFTVLVSLVMVLGALVIGVVLLFSGAPAALVVGTLLAAVPVVPLVGCYLWLDRYEPEPRSLLVLGLGWGAFVATSIALVLQAFDTFALGAGEASTGVVVAPLTEEGAKGLFILLLLWFRRQELDGVLDGIVYAGMVGVGFAFTENILYLTSAYMGQDGSAGGLESAVGLFVVRCVFSPFAHPLFTACTGIGIGIAVNARSGAVRVLAPLVGYAVAVAAHGLWNASLMFDAGAGAVVTYVGVMLPALLLFTALAVWARAREGRLLAVSLADCARRGFLHPAEIPWLVRLPARRASRRHAEAVGGPAAREAMAAYQREAIELGYLHHRWLRGTPPAGFAELGQEHVEAMRALRPALVWPRPTTTTRLRAAGGIA